MNRFEKGALGVMGMMVAAVVGVSLLTPVDRATAAPRADLAELKASLQRAALQPVVLPPKPILHGGLQALSTLHRRDTTAKRLSAAFREIGYDFQRVMAGQHAVPRLFLPTLPRDMAKIRESKTRKAVFFQSILPLVLQVNEEIRAERRRLWRLRYEQATGGTIDAVDQLWLIALAEKYRVKRGDVTTLLKRVDIIPPSLALAQAAEESGWGTSRFVREGNAVFGQWTWAKSGGIVPREREEGKTHKVRRFETLMDSVRAYARNLNTHPAYKALRARRADMRHAGDPVDGLNLAESLDRYSERGPAYVETLRSIISHNDLLRLDDARLQSDRVI